MAYHPIETAKKIKIEILLSITNIVKSSKHETKLSQYYENIIYPKPHLGKLIFAQVFLLEYHRHQIQTALYSTGSK
jgi:hypothetical protein